MDWETITRLVTLISVAALIFGGLIKLSQILTPLITEMTEFRLLLQQLSEDIKSHKEEFAAQIKNNSRKHKELWEELERQDDKIGDNEKKLIDHENRLNMLEKQ